MNRRRARHLPPELPLPRWTEELQEWKLRALESVLKELDHICSGPRSLPKSFCLSEAVRNVVARDFDPESQTGIHLLHILSGAIAQQLIRRSGLHAEMHSQLPGGARVPVDFVLTYLNSRWWLDTFLQLEGISCGDVRGAVLEALAVAEQEVVQAAAV